MPGDGAELLFERLAVRWEIAGLPLTDQRMLLGRYRMADPETRDWVRRTLTEHIERHIPNSRDRRLRCNLCYALPMSEKVKNQTKFPASTR